MSSEASPRYALLHKLCNSAGTHTLWSYTPVDGPECFVVCVGHKPDEPRYTRGFSDKQEATNYWAERAI